VLKTELRYTAFNFAFNFNLCHYIMAVAAVLVASGVRDLGKAVQPPMNPVFEVHGIKRLNLEYD